MPFLERFNLDVPCRVSRRCKSRFDYVTKTHLLSFKQKGVTVVAADKVGDSGFLYEEAQALSPWIEIKVSAAS